MYQADNYSTERRIIFMDNEILTIAIHEHLESRNIKILFPEEITDADPVFGMNLYFLGLAINTLTDNKILDTPVNIYNAIGSMNPNEIRTIIFNATKKENGYVLCIDNYVRNGELFNLKSDKVLVKYIEQETKTKLITDIAMVNFEDGCGTIIEVSPGTKFSAPNVSSLISILPRLLPGLISKDIIKEKLRYLGGMKNIKTHEELKKYIMENSQLDFELLESEFIKNGIIKCMGYEETRRKSELGAKLESCRAKSNALMREYNSVIEDMNETLAILNALDGGESFDEKKSLLLDFLITNKCISVKKFLDNAISYDVVTELCYFDKDIFEVHSAKTNSGYMYSEINVGDRLICKEMLDRIFLKKKYKILTVARFVLKIDHVSTIQCPPYNSWFNTDEYNACILAPHAGLYVCFGDFTSIITSSLMAGDYITAMQSTISLTQNINWGDASVCSRFLKNLLVTSCIQDVDTGELFTGYELMSRIRKESEDEEEIQNVKSHNN